MVCSTPRMHRVCPIRFRRGAHGSPTSPAAPRVRLVGSAGRALPTGSRAETLKKGSAYVVLRTDPPFGRYIFVDRNPTHAESLGALRKEFPKLANRISVRAADANTFLQQWCRETDWNRNRAVVCLDPDGMQVDWATIETIAATEAIDLWILFPLGQAVNRLLTKSDIPEGGQADRLTRFFGTDGWKEAFYEEASNQPSMFDQLGEGTGYAKRT